MLRSLAVVLSLGLISGAIAQEPKATPSAEAAKALAAVVQATAARPVPRGSFERETVDPEDAIERFALLTSGGPLIVQAALTIDGQPFRVGREKLLKEMIAAADADQDGQTTWTEALASSRFTFGRLGNVPEQVRQNIIRTLDKNSNSLVEPSEARHFLAQYSQGATFSLGGGPTSLRVVVAGMLQPATTGHPDVLALLDSDKSQTLDAQELAAAFARLKSRDADDNDVLEASEISGELPASTRSVVVDRSAAPPSDVILLGPTATAQVVFGALREKYKDSKGQLAAGCFALFPQLFRALDKDHNQYVEPREVLGLNEVAPHIELTVDLGAQRSAGGIKITSQAADIHGSVDHPGNKVLELPGVRISLTASTAASPNRNFDLTAKSLLTQFDKDGNGYLDKSELPPLPGQFEMYDADGDGKAFVAEIAAGYARQFAPQQTQVVASVVQQSNSLFQSLDANGDGRLGLREIRLAAERLSSLDTDHDQTIGGIEIPEVLSVSFALGSSSLAQVVQRPRTAFSGGRPAAGAAPEWFTRMDRNGDGDVTLKEFLGSAADFERLDTSGDGLLDAQEAKAAGA